MSDELKPKLDDFTAKVVSEPAKPQDTLLLQGFLGASSQPDHTRVYSDLTLSSYVDVANADIIHIEPMPKEQSPMGGSYLWVKKEAEVLPAAAPGEVSAKAKFLQGPIASEAAGVVAQPVGLPKTIPIVACHPTIVLQACFPTRFPRCFVTEIVCPTRPVVCDTVISGTGPCNIPDPTIWQETPQFQGGAFAPAAAQAPAPQQALFATAVCPRPTLVAACHHQTLSPSVCIACPSVHTIFCQPTNVAGCHHTLIGPECFVRTPLCPQQVASIACGEQFGGTQQFGVAEPQIALRPTLAASVCHVCPTQTILCHPTNPIVCHQTITGPECPVRTPLCPQQAASVACGEQLGGTQQFAAAAQQAQPLLAPSVAGRACPTLHCPTPLNHCPSVNHFHCPKTTHAAGCPPTPNIQHCPTPNNICPRPTISFDCPSVAEICPTTSPLFC